jgi:hypothetical protein
MTRIFWLALICLISLGVLGAMKMTASPVATASASHVEPTALMTAEHDALAKADKLKVHQVEPMPEPTVITPVAIAPPKIPPKAVEITKIISRHWHDPMAPKASSR